MRQAEMAAFLLPFLLSMSYCDGNVEVLASPDLDGGHIPSVQNLADSDDSSGANQDTDITKDISNMLKENIMAQLHRDRYQWINAIIMLAFGKFMLWDGQVSFKITLTCFIALMTYVFAMSQLALGWEDDLGSVVSHIVAVEAAGLTFWMVWAGSVAMQYSLGAILGYMLAVWIKTQAASILSTSAVESEVFKIICWNVCIILGLWVFHGDAKMNKIATTVVASFFGAAFVVASFAYFIMLLATFMPGVMASMDIQIDAEQQPPAGYWIDYFLCMYSVDYPDVGIFEQKTGSHLAIFGATMYLDCFFMRLFWVLFFVAGIIIAWKVRPRMDKSGDKKGSKREDKTAESTGDNREPDEMSENATEVRSSSTPALSVTHVPGSRDSRGMSSMFSGIASKLRGLRGGRSTEDPSAA